ncbi:MAG: hypothetical protein K8T91_23655 [Planctomycetes bacterium]|nr:hypothetical protein [Planctomycetota bacterium]
MSYRRFSITCVLFLVSLVGSVTLADQSKDKLPVPAEAAQAESLKLIKDVYKADYDAAQTTMQKSAFANKLIEKGIETIGDPAGRYVLFRVARDIAIQISDFNTAVRAVNEMDKSFQVDTLEMKTDLLTKAAGATHSATKAAAISKDCLDAIGVAVATDRYDLAQRLGKVALATANQAKEADRVKRVIAWSKEVDEIERAHKEAEKAFAVLAKEPTDSDANFIVGKFQCFNKGDWEKGLQPLALGSDVTLKNLAAKELRDEKTAAEQMELADGWWDISEHSSGFSKKRVQQRAAKWYGEVLLGSTGLTKDKVTKRLADASAGVADQVQIASGQDQLKSTPASVDVRDRMVGKPLPGATVKVATFKSICDAVAKLSQDASRVGPPAKQKTVYRAAIRKLNAELQTLQFSADLKIAEVTVIKPKVYRLKVEQVEQGEPGVELVRSVELASNAADTQPLEAGDVITLSGVPNVDVTSQPTGQSTENLQKLNQEHGFYSDGTATYAGVPNTVWIRGNANSFGNTYYMIRSTGDLHAWAGGSLTNFGPVIAHVGNDVYQNSSLLLNAQAKKDGRKHENRDKDDQAVAQQGANGLMICVYSVPDTKMAATINLKKWTYQLQRQRKDGVKEGAAQPTPAQ